MVEESIKHYCFFCGDETDTFTRDAVNKTKVPICKGCFMEIYPSKKNKRKLWFWMILYPIIEEAR